VNINTLFKKGQERIRLLLLSSLLIPLLILLGNLCSLTGLGALNKIWDIRIEKKRITNVRMSKDYVDVNSSRRDVVIRKIADALFKMKDILTKIFLLHVCIPKP